MDMNMCIPTGLSTSNRTSFEKMVKMFYYLILFLYLNEITYNDTKTKIILPRKHLRKFFAFHEEKIEEINKNKKINEKIDSFIFIYSGHGKSKLLECMDGKLYKKKNLFVFKI